MYKVIDRCYEHVIPKNIKPIEVIEWANSKGITCTVGKFIVTFYTESTSLDFASEFIYGWTELKENLGKGKTDDNE